MDKVLDEAQQGLEKVYTSVIDAIEKGKLSPAALIANHQLLYGRYIDSRISRTARGGELISSPHNIETTLKTPDQTSTELTTKHDTTRSNSKLNSHIDQYGWSWMASLEGGGAGVVGGGILSISAAANLQRMGEESEEESTSEASTTATLVKTRYIFMPKAIIAFDTKDLKLSSAAETSLSEIFKATDEAGKKLLILKFYKDFGTHVSTAATLGGWYRLSAIATSRTRETRHQLEKTATTALDCGVNMTASYAGQFAATVKTAIQHGENKETADSEKSSSTEKDLDVRIETTVKGGEPGLPVDLWRHTLQYNSTWAVIDRDELIPVWTLIDNHVDYHKLAPQFMKVWVQNIFARSLTGLPRAVQARASENLAKVDELDELFRELAPQLEIRVFTDSYPIPPVNGIYHGFLQVQVHADYKLIGGGARVYIGKEGKGNFLTASYPINDTTWEARCKDHKNVCPATLEVWAVGLYDPLGEWETKRFDAKPPEKAQHPSVTAMLDPGYVLTGGGAYAKPQSEATGGSLLTKSYPVGEHGWAAESKDLFDGDKATLTAYAIGIKPAKKDRALPIIKVFSAKSQKSEHHASAVVRLPQGYKLLSGGAHANWREQGHYLVGSSPDEDNASWNVESWDHISPEECTITAYAIGVPDPKPQ